MGQFISVGNRMLQNVFQSMQFDGSNRLSAE